MGWDIGGHAHCDTGGAVDQQVGQRSWQDGGLGDALFVVGDKVDGVFVDIFQHVLRDRLQFTLGVTIGGGGIAIDRTKITLRNNQWVAHHPILGQADQGVVNGAIAVRVIVFEDFPHHAGAFIEIAIV